METWETVLWAGSWSSLWGCFCSSVAVPIVNTFIPVERAKNDGFTVLIQLGQKFIEPKIRTSAEKMVDGFAKQLCESLGHQGTLNRNTHDRCNSFDPQRSCEIEYVCQ